LCGLADPSELIIINMESKLDEGLATIKQARDYVKEANYAFARDCYSKGLGLLHRVYSEEK
jgi:hypothetical protein